MVATRYEISPDDLSRAVFLQNGNNGRIILDFPRGPRDARGAFNFLLDLFLKGLVLMFGGAEARVDVGSLEPHQVALAVDRMRHLGVNVRIVTADAATSVAEDDEALLDAARMLREAGNSLASETATRIEDLSFTLRSADRILRVSFEIIP